MLSSIISKSDRGSSFLHLVFLALHRFHLRGTDQKIQKTFFMFSFRLQLLSLAWDHPKNTENCLHVLFLALVGFICMGLTKKYIKLSSCPLSGFSWFYLPGTDQKIYKTFCVLFLALVAFTCMGKTKKYTKRSSCSRPGFSCFHLHGTDQKIRKTFFMFFSSGFSCFHLHGTNQKIQETFFAI